MKRRSQTKNFKDKVSATLEKQKQIIMLKNLFEVQFVHCRTIVHCLSAFPFPFLQLSAFSGTPKSDILMNSSTLLYSVLHAGSKQQFARCFFLIRTPTVFGVHKNLIKTKCPTPKQQCNTKRSKAKQKGCHCASCLLTVPGNCWLLQFHCHMMANT